MPHKNRIYKLKPLFSLAALFLAALSPTTYAAKSLQFAWNPSTDPAVAGYKISYGVSSGTYTQTVNVGNATSATISPLNSSTTYYFILTSYNSAGLQSVPSNEISITVGPNIPPTVTLTSPQSGASVTGLTPIALTATASDPDGSIAKVEFYEDSTKIGEATANPYSAAWDNAPVGNYTITALAYDDSGAAVRSAGANLTVTGAGTPPPIPSPAANPKVRVFATSSIIPAGANARFRFAASEINSGPPMVVNYSMGGTATAGTNYSMTGLTGQVTIPSGARGVNLDVDTLAGAGSGRRTIVVTAQSGTNYALGLNYKATVLIVPR
jgi:hypothetical protein